MSTPPALPTPPKLSKRERTTRMAVWAIIALCGQGTVLGLVMLFCAWKQVDVTPAQALLGSVVTLLMTGVAAVAGGVLGYTGADTLRPSGDVWRGMGGNATPAPSPAAPEVDVHMDLDTLDDDSEPS